MNKKAKDVIQKILLGAIAALIHPSESQAVENKKTNLEGLNNDDANDVVSALKASPYNDVYMVNSNGEGRYVSMHRSHSSHRSHRSSNTGHTSHTSHSSSSNSYHYSSSYSGSSSGSTTTKSNSLYSSPSSTSTNKNTTTVSSSKKTYDSYNLGDRSLSADMMGHDVSKLVSLLEKNLYIRESWVKKKDGFCVYGAEVTAAVKRFQKDAGITVTGKADATSVSALESWDYSKTRSIKLGVRDIIVGNKGLDVYNLIDLLRKAGFAPDPTKIMTSEDGLTIYTEDIKNAVEFFQTYNDLDVTGIADEKTVVKLNAVVDGKKKQ